MRRSGRGQSSPAATAHHAAPYSGSRPLRRQRSGSGMGRVGKLMRVDDGDMMGQVQTGLGELGLSASPLPPPLSRNKARQPGSGGSGGSRERPRALPLRSVMNGDGIGGVDSPLVLSRGVSDGSMAALSPSPRSAIGANLSTAFNQTMSDDGGSGSRAPPSAVKKAHEYSLGSGGSSVTLSPQQRGAWRRGGGSGSPRLTVAAFDDIPHDASVSGDSDLDSSWEGGDVSAALEEAANESSLLSAVTPSSKRRSPALTASPVVASAGSNALASAARYVADDTMEESFLHGEASPVTDGRPSFGSVGITPIRSVPTARPQPDQSAFDSESSDDDDFRSARPTPSKGRTPQPPPTPSRTPAWAHLAPTPHLRRQTSLIDNKTLVEVAHDSDDEAEGGGGDGGGKRSEHPAHHHLHSYPGEEFTFNKHFENLRHLGSGSFYVVCEARSKEDGQTYAVKKTQRQFRSTKDRATYLNEVKLYQRVGDHPNVVQYYRAWQEKGHLYLQLELCPQGSLRDLLNHQPEGVAIPEDAIRCFISDLASGLSAIHRAGLVHLDVKPENSFISSEGRLKIGDFGAAREASVEGDGVEGDSRYMAPELLESEGDCASADIFSLGMLAFELAWDVSVPTEGHNWRRLRQDALPKLPARTTAVGRSKFLVDLVAAMLSSDPTKRPTAAQIAEMPEIAAASDGANPFIASVKTGPPPMPPTIPENGTLGRSASYSDSLMIDIPSDIDRPFDGPSSVPDHEGYRCRAGSRGSGPMSARSSGSFGALTTPKDQPVMFEPHRF